MNRCSKVLGGAVALLSMMALVVPARGAGFFDDIGTGARPTSMGGSFVAIADDANAIFLNPSGLTQLGGRELTTMYARLYPGIEDDKLHQALIGYVQPFEGVGVIGLGWQTVMADVADENTITLSYARSITPGFSFGVNIKGMFWKADLSGLNDPLGDSVSSGLKVGVDVGALWLSPWRLRVGVFARNVNQPNIAKDTSIDGGKKPMELRAGLAYDLVQTLVSAELKVVDGDLSLAGGLERRLGAGFELRAGGGQSLEKDVEAGQINAGLGYRFHSFVLDYSYVYLLEIADTQGAHRVSFGYRF